MGDNIQFVTKEKLLALKEELDHLQKEKMPTIAKRIDDARQMGDLSENAEYHAAREEMAWAVSRAKEIERILQDAEVISDDKGGSVIRIGSKIEVELKGKIKEYQIVGAQEANPLEGKISNLSPLGEALLGRKVGDRVQVEVPSGVQEYTIKKIL